MKLTFKLTLLFLILGYLSFGQNWINTEVTEFASIDFPDQAEITETGQETVYFSQDDYAYYVVSVRTLTDQQSRNFSDNDIPEIYRGATNGMVNAAGGALISKKDITIDGYPALEIEYSASSNSNLPVQRFARIVFIEKSLITSSFWLIEEDNAESITRKTSFFNSLSFQKSTTNINEEFEDPNVETTTSSYNYGYLIGQIVAALALLIILIVILYFIFKKRNTKKKTQKEPVAPSKPTFKICNNCDFNNRSDTKYCSRCGYELK